MAHLHSAELTKYWNWLLSLEMAPAMPPPAAWTDPNIPRLAEITNTKLAMSLQECQGEKLMSIVHLSLLTKVSQAYPIIYEN